MDGCGRRVDVCNSGSRRVPSSIVAVVAVGVCVAAAAAAVVVGGSGLLGKCGEHREVSAPQQTLHTSANPNQGCKGSDRLYAKQSPSG